MSDLTKYEKLFNLLSEAILIKEQAAYNLENDKVFPGEEDAVEFLEKMEVLKIAELLLKIEQVENIEWVGQNV